MFGLFRMLGKIAVHTAGNHQRNRKKVNPDQTAAVKREQWP